MPDIATISTLLSSVKTATDIAKFVKDSDSSIEGAEIKLKMAELVSALADVKMELADLQDALRERDQKIVQLKSELQQKSATKFDGQLYWMDEDKTPFCTVCMEKDEKYHHLTFNKESEYNSESWFCNICENYYYTST